MAMHEFLGSKRRLHYLAALAAPVVLTAELAGPALLHWQDGNFRATLFPERFSCAANDLTYSFFLSPVMQSTRCRSSGRADRALPATAINIGTTQMRRSAC